LVLLAALFAFHFYLVCSRSVDMLNFDEWVIWWPADGHTWFTWLFAPYNEFILVPTKVLLLFCEKWLTGDPRVLIALNFLFYAGIPLWFLVFAWRSRQVPIAGVALLGVFFFSPIAFENHFTAMQSCFHFSVLLPLLAVSLLFRASPSGAMVATAVAALCLAVFCSAAGAAAALAVASVFVLSCGRHRRLGAGVLLPVLVAVVVWAIARRMPGQPVTPITFPWTGRFWDFFLNAVSGGWGIDRESTLIGGICFVFALVPAVGLALRGRRNTPQQWAMVAVLAMAFAICIAITLVRAYSAIGASKSSRYREYEMLFLFAVPAAYALWLKAKHRALAFVGLFVVCLYSFSDNWNFAFYDGLQSGSLEGRRCVAEYLRHGGESFCPNVFPGPLAPHLELGKRWQSPLIERLQN
jgi:hypothetical protein